MYAFFFGLRRRSSDLVWWTWNSTGTKCSSIYIYILCSVSISSLLSRAARAYGNRSFLSFRSLNGFSFLALGSRELINFEYVSRCGLLIWFFNLALSVWLSHVWPVGSIELYTSVSNSRIYTNMSRISLFYFPHQDTRILSNNFGRKEGRPTGFNPEIDKIRNAPLLLFDRFRRTLTPESIYQGHTLN